MESSSPHPSVAEVRRRGRHQGAAYEDALFSRWFAEPLSFPIAALFLRTTMTANQASVLHLMVTVVSAVMLASGRHPWMLAGAILANVGFVLDYVDGAIARFRGTAGPLGQFVDDLISVFAYVLLLAAAGMGVYLQTDGDIAYLVLGIGGAFLAMWRQLIGFMHREIAGERPSEEQRLSKQYGGNPVVRILIFIRENLAGEVLVFPLLIAVICRHLETFLILYVAIFVCEFIATLALYLRRLRKAGSAAAEKRL